jgi:hypothetical protein
MEQILWVRGLDRTQQRGTGHSFLCPLMSGASGGRLEGWGLDLSEGSIAYAPDGQCWLLVLVDLPCAG